MTMTNRSDTPIGELGELDAELARTVRRTGYMRQLFYVVVLLVALAGQVSGAVQALGIPLIWAIPAVGALELGGVVVLANADVRRWLGEKATASRILSAAIAAGAVAFNWMAHDNKLLAGFFAGMSALGYLVWLMHTENQRRDRLRAKRQLPPTTPAYEVVGHWLRHPWLTLRAKNLAKADSKLGLYSSIAAAKAETRKEQRTGAIAKVLIRAAVDPTTADIAIAVYDLDEIAVRLADGADYDGLTALIANDLTPTQLSAALQAMASPAETPDALDLDPPVGTADFAQFTAGVDDRLADLTAAVTDRDTTIEALNTELASVRAELTDLRRAVAQGASTKPERPRERRTVVARSETTTRARDQRTAAPASNINASRLAVVESVVRDNPGVTGTKLDPLIAQALDVSERTARRAREEYQRAQASTPDMDAPATAGDESTPSATTATTGTVQPGRPDHAELSGSGEPDQRSKTLRLVENVA